MRIRLVLLAVLLPLLVASTGAASTISLKNQGFEQPAVGLGGTCASIPGWTGAVDLGGNCEAGIWQPTDDYIDPWEGQQVGWANPGYIMSADSFQLAVGDYTVEFAVGRRKDIGPGGGGAPTYWVIDVQDWYTSENYDDYYQSDNTVFIDPGKWIIVDVPFTVRGYLDPETDISSNVDWVKVSLINPGNLQSDCGEGKVCGGQVEFDAVIPEPGSLLLLGTGLIGAAGLIRRKFAR